MRLAISSAQRLHLPATEVLVDVGCRSFQVGKREILLQAQHAVAHQTAARHHDSQHLLVGQPLKVHMLQRVALRRRRTDGHAHAVRDQRQHMRSALHELLQVLGSLQRALDQALVGRRESSLARQLLHIKTIGMRGRYASGRGVRLLQKSRVGQVGHDIADGRGAQVLAIGARQRTRPHRLARGDVGLHDGGQNLAFAFADTGG